MALRFGIALLCLAGAGWIMVGLPGVQRFDHLLHLTAAVCLLLMAIAIALRPLRWSGGFAFTLFLTPIAVFCIYDPHNGRLVQLGGVLFLLLLGAAMRGLFEHTPERVRDDLNSPDATDRARGVRNLRFLLKERLRPAAASSENLLAASLASEDAYVRSQAEAMRDGPPTGRGDTFEDLDDELAESLAVEALSEPAPEILEDVPGEPPESIESLIATLRKGEPAACRAALAGLISHGAAAVPALRAAADEGDPDLRVDALRALAEIAED